MALTMTGRAGWGARPPKSRTPWDVSKLDGICQHWFGSPKAATSHAGCDDLLRGVQNAHMAPGGLGVPAGGSDIAYNIAVCPHGTVYELRGWDTQTGANGSSDANRRFLAVVYMAGTGNTLTVKGKAALKKVYEEAFRRGVGVKAVGHGSLTGSECPGPSVRAWLASGQWKPTAKVTLWEIDFPGIPLDPATKKHKRVKVEIGNVPRWVSTHPGAFQRGPVYIRPRS